MGIIQKSLHTVNAQSAIPNGSHVIVLQVGRKKSYKTLSNSELDIFSNRRVLYLEENDAVCVFDDGRSIRSEEIFNLRIFTQRLELGGRFATRQYRHFWSDRSVILSFQMYEYQ